MRVYQIHVCIEEMNPITLFWRIVVYNSHVIIEFVRIMMKNSCTKTNVMYIKQWRFKCIPFIITLCLEKMYDV